MYKKMKNFKKVLTKIDSRDNIYLYQEKKFFRGNLVIKRVMNSIKKTSKITIFLCLKKNKK